MLADGTIVVAGGGALPATPRVPAQFGELVRLDSQGNPIGDPIRYGLPGVATTHWGVTAAGGLIVAAGERSDGQAYAVAYDEAGMLLWEFVQPGLAFDVVFDGNAILWLVGRSGVAPYVAKVWALDLNGVAVGGTIAMDVENRLPAGAAAIYAAAQRTSGRLLLSGSYFLDGEEQAWASLINPLSGTVLQGWVFGDQFPVPEAAAYGAALSANVPEVMAFSGHYVDPGVNDSPRGWLQRRNSGGQFLSTLLQEEPQGGNYHSIAYGPEDEIVVIGWVAVGNGKRISVVKYDGAGEKAWTAEAFGDTPFEAENTGWNVVVGPDGVVYATGEVVVVTPGGESIARWIAAYAP